MDDVWLRCRYAEAGRSLVEKRYCIEANLAILESVLIGDMK